jgi:hypothetical protein
MPHLTQVLKWTYQDNQGVFRDANNSPFGKMFEIGDENLPAR